MKIILGVILYIVAAPLVGGILAGIDRVLSAKLQSRVGPPLLQPFYDVLKLFEKRTMIVNRFQNAYAWCHVIFMAMTGAFFFEGGDILLAVFALTLAGIFLILGAYSSNSPYSYLGAERELVLMLAYEPMVILTMVGMYMVAQSFSFMEIAASQRPIILYLPGVFLGFLYILPMKLRKSPFDISSSHHAHQELVRGLTSDFSGSMLALIEIAHWYETTLLLGLVYLFFSFNPVVGVCAAFGTYFLGILVDNSYARLKWELAFTSAWGIALVLGGGNLAILYFIAGG